MLFNFINPLSTSDIDRISYKFIQAKRLSTTIALLRVTNRKLN